MTLFLVWKISRLTGNKVYKSRKTLDLWSRNRTAAYAFTQRGAVGIVKRLRENDVSGVYEYGFDTVVLDTCKEE